MTTNDHVQLFWSLKSICGPFAQHNNTIMKPKNQYLYGDIRKAFDKILLCCVIYLKGLLENLN